MNTPKLQLNRNVYHRINSVFTGEILPHFRCFHVFVTRCTTVITTGKGFFYMLAVYRDVVTANGTNGIVIVPKASGTLNHRSYGHIPILTMMTWFSKTLSEWCFLVRLAITFHIIAFRMTFLAFTAVADVATATVIITRLHFLGKPFLFLVNRSKSSCFY